MLYTSSLRIGVVVPCRNDQLPLAGCLASLAPFVTAGDQVLVVDGNTDEAVALLAQSQGAAYLASADGLRGSVIGCGVAWLLRQQRVDVLLICHADMKLCPGTRDKLSAGLGVHARERWGWLGHRIDGDRPSFRLLEWGNRFRGAILNIPYGDQAMFVGVDLLAKAGGWPFQPEMEDLELSLRLRRLAPTVLIDAPVSISARHWAKGIGRATVHNWTRAAGYIMGREPPQDRCC